MIVNSRRLTKATVRTAGGTVIGRVASVEFDGDTGRCVSLLVSPRGMVVGLLAHELCIPWPSIVSLTEQEVIVKEGTVPSSAGAFTAKFAARTRPAGSHFKEA